MLSNLNKYFAPHYAARRFDTVCTIVNGVEQVVPNRRLYIAANAANALELQNQLGGFGMPWTQVVGSAHITGAQAQAFVDIINKSYGDNQHRRVLDHPDWRAIYGVAIRPLTYLGHGGAPMVAPAADYTVPCHDCHLVLPLRNIAIDHQRPVSGSDSEPVCKVFRAMGLTQSGPAGPKGTSVVAAYSAAVGGVAGVAPARGAVGVARDAKYTLNDRGQMFYSLVKWADDLMSLEECCLNHVINLRPLCGACNTSNRNVQYY
jgi:hypothetical protein